MDWYFVIFTLEEDETVLCPSLRLKKEEVSKHKKKATVLNIIASLGVSPFKTEQSSDGY